MGCYGVNYDFFIDPGDGPWKCLPTAQLVVSASKTPDPALILVLGALGGIIDFGIKYHFAWLAHLSLIGSNFFGSRTSPKHSCFVSKLLLL